MAKKRYSNEEIARILVISMTHFSELSLCPALWWVLFCEVGGFFRIAARGETAKSRKRRKAGYQGGRGHRGDSLRGRSGRCSCWTAVA